METVLRKILDHLEPVRVSLGTKPIDLPGDRIDDTFPSFWLVASSRLP